MDSSPIISINLWQILISLANLLIIFLILKKFLWKPIKRVMNERQSAIDEQYAAAQQDKEAAAADRQEWEAQLEGAKAQAETILQEATAAADRRGAEIVAAAQEKADRIRRQAEADAALEKTKAENEVKQEIVDVSALLAEQMLKREINADDHRSLINAFLDNVDAGE